MMPTSKPKSTKPPKVRNELNFRKLVQIMRKRWAIIAVAVAAGATFAVVFQLVCPRKYESKSQLLVMRKDPRLAARGVESGSDSELKVTEDLLATHMQLLQSRSMVDGALKDNELSDLPSIVEHLGERQKPCDYVIDNMTVSRGGFGQARSAHVLNVALKSPSDIDSETILRAIIKKYQLFLDTKFQDVNSEAANLIAVAQSKLQTELEEAEKAYERFRQQSSNLMWKTGSETTNIHRVRYETILQEIASLQLSRADSAARLDAVNERLEGRELKDLSDLEKLSLVDEKNLARVGLLLMAQRGETESPSFQAEQPLRQAQARVEYENFASMQIKEKQLLIEMGPQHPEVIGLQKQVASLKDFMAKQRSDLKSGASISLDPSALFTSYQQLLKNDIVAMERREHRLNLLANESVALASNMVTDELQGEALRRDVQRKQELFDAAVDRLRDINLTKDYGGFINEILSEPEPGLKVMPRMSFSLGLGFLLTLAIGVFGVGVAEYRDRRFRTLDDLRSTLDTDVLGQIPIVETEARKKLSMFKRGPTEISRRTTLLLQPQSRGSDAFRMLRACPIFSDGDEGRKAVCFTSPNPADGKSTIVGNLAVSLGQLGRRVLVIDCDLRRPTQHELFSMSNERGLTTLLNEDLDAADVIQATACKNVDLLTRGESVPDPSEFLASGKFSRLLKVLWDKYDNILLDCPPILPVVDALVPASIVGSVILVIRLDCTSRLHTQAACSMIRRSVAHIDGVVLNGSEGILSEESYGYGYRYGYSDYENEAPDAAIVKPKSAPTNSTASGGRLDASLTESKLHRNESSNGPPH
ncbi:MAG: hypothetical protein JWP89_6947 [Schlesneria sp.]|nr:hypothetical protein [Schlesneria sp.]